MRRWGPGQKPGTLLQPTPAQSPHSILPPPGPPEIRLLPFPASPLSLSGKCHLLQMGLVLPAGDAKIHLGPPALLLTVSQGGGRVHQSVEQGRACRAVGPCCGGVGGLAVSPLLSWGLQPHSLFKASLRAFSSFSQLYLQVFLIPFSSLSYLKLYFYFFNFVFLY